jgi:hypothetical protein
VSVSGASGSVAVWAAAGSVFFRTGARFWRVGAREGARFGDAPARSTLRGSGPGGGHASATLVCFLVPLADGSTVQKEVIIWVEIGIGGG